jgi:hypothetical protein
MGSPTVLFLDGDLGFVLALSLELSKRHVIAFPGRTASEAWSLMTRFQLRPDLLVIDCSSPDACSFAESVIKERPDLKIIGIVSERYHCEECANRLAATFRDPEDQAPELIPNCADTIQRLLRGHLHVVQNTGET